MDVQSHMFKTVFSAKVSVLCVSSYENTVGDLVVIAGCEDGQLMISNLKNGDTEFKAGTPSGAWARPSA